MMTNRMSGVTALRRLSDRLTNTVRHSLSAPEYANRPTPIHAAYQDGQEIKRILVPLDGTVFAEHALPLALAIAEECDAVLQLVHVLVPSEVLAPFEMLHFPDAAFKDKKNHQHAYLSKVAHQVATTSPVGVSSAVVQGIDASNALHDNYGHASDLVVMATHGRGPLGRFWWGSVAHSLLQRTTVPLVLVSGHEMKPDFVRQPIDNLILPIDRDKQSAKIIDPLLEMGLFATARHSLLHVTRPELVVTNAGTKSRGEWVPTSSREAEGMEILGPVGEVLAQDSRQVELKVISSEKSAWKVVSDYANHFERSLVACTYRRTRLLERIVWPGMSENLLRAAKCPLMLVPV